MPDEFNPISLRRVLDDYVIGQSRAKGALIHAFIRWQNRLDMLDRGRSPEDCPNRNNVLLVGPSGSGKTLLVRTLAAQCNAPFVHVDASRYTATGYVGIHVSDALDALLKAAGGDERRARHGVIFWDEIDKLANRLGHEAGVSTTGVQQELLLHLEGGAAIQGTELRPQSFETSEILNVSAGAFSGIDQIVSSRARSARREIGFGGSRNAEVSTAIWVTTDDLVEYGMLRELIGRFGLVAELEPLDEQQLVEVLTESRVSPIRRLKALFSDYGVDLRFSRPALDVVAAKAAAMGLGARALQGIVDEIVREAELELPDLWEKRVVAVCIDDGVARGFAKPAMCKTRRRRPKPPALKRPRDESRSDHEIEIEIETEVISRVFGGAAEKGTSDFRASNDDPLVMRLEKIKHEQLDWRRTSALAKRWWLAFEQQESGRLPLVLRVAEELSARRATINDFYGAWAHADTDNIQAVLHFLDYLKLKKSHAEKSPRRATAEDSPVANPSRDHDWEDREDEPASLVFVRCPSCRSLIPNISELCRMCGEVLEPR